MAILEYAFKFVKFRIACILTNMKPSQKYLMNYK